MFLKIHCCCSKIESIFILEIRKIEMILVNLNKRSIPEFIKNLNCMYVLTVHRVKVKIDRPRKFVFFITVCIVLFDWF